MNKLRGTKVYLSGSIERVADCGEGWRDSITPRLAAFGVSILNPCRKHSSLDENKEHVQLVRNLKALGCYQEVRDRMRDIVGHDLRMLEKSDFVILYIDTSVHLCGSYHEHCFATIMKKPVFVVCKQGVADLPGWVFGITPVGYLFNNFDDMFIYMSKLDSGEAEMDRRWKLLDL